MTGIKGYRKFLIIIVFLLPNLIGIMIFKGIPMISSFFISLTEWKLLNKPKWIGLANYKNILTSPDFYNPLVHTLYFIAGYLPLVMVLALITALILNRKMKGVMFFRAIYFLPVITSWVAVSMIWLWLFNPQYGLINYVISLFGITGPGWMYDPKWAMPSVIITSVWKDTGFVMIMYLAGLQNISDDYYEAAEIDGASSVQKFFKITLPLLTPTTFFVLIISLINSFQVFDQVWIMTQGGPAGATSVLVEQIYKNAFKYYKMGYASALSWILFAMIFIFTYFQNRLQKRWVGYDQ